VQNANLLKVLVIIRGNPQRLDRDSLVVISAFPYVGDGTGGDWAITHSGDLIRYDVRGWQGRVATADCLQFFYAFSRNIVGGGDVTEGLSSLFRKLMKG